MPEAPPRTLTEPATPPALLPVSSLRGLGAASARALAEGGIERVGDLPFVLPLGYDDLTRPFTVAEAVARAGERPRVAVRAVVRAATTPYVRGRRCVRVTLADASGADPAAKLEAWWFFAAHGVLAAARPGVELLLVGTISPARSGRGTLMAHPDLLPAATAPTIRPRYPRLGVPPARLRTAVVQALELLGGAPPDPVPEDVAAREGMRPLAPLLRDVHLPAVVPPPSTLHDVVTHLAWAEAFASVWDRTALEARVAHLAAPALRPDGSPLDALRAALGFEWTAGQRLAISAVAADLARPVPMRRLVFGDVGSGKTAVALAAAALAVASGGQVALFAPTTVLAEQYALAARPLAQSLGARVAILSRAQPAAERRAALADAAAGRVDLVIGTHALLSDELQFARLVLVVVDEQHRLGVSQRFALVRKAGEGSEPQRPHLLTLSATPIPRTLALALRGDLAVSEIPDRPAGRHAVTTRLVPRTSKLDAVDPAIERALEAGERVFVVCPRIGDPDLDDEAGGGAAPGAVDQFGSLVARYGRHRVVLAHGAMPPRELVLAMRRFRRGSRGAPEGEGADVLVGTTVVEVGIDVPEATLMVIEGAEHFGLAQLHQLRGRVGRGERPGRCLLVHGEPLAASSRLRLLSLVEHASGHEVARCDLELRGAGDLDGLRQSGDSGLRFLDPMAEPPWLARIGDDVARIRRDDPELLEARHLGLRLALPRLRRALTVREEAG